MARRYRRMIRGSRANQGWRLRKRFAADRHGPLLV